MLRSPGGVVFCVAALLAAAGCRERPSAVQPSTAGAGPRVAIDGRGSWAVELAVTTAQRNKGLAGRREMPTGQGMLFCFREPAVREFWMEGCLVPLDIAFIGPDMRVMKTYRMAVESDRRGHVLYSSPGPAQYALEAAAGELERAGVKVGDTVRLEGIPEDAKAKADP